MKCLDIGCGEFKMPNSIGMDSNPKFKPDKLGDIFDIPFNDNAFDIVYCFHVFEHLPHEKRYEALKELLRVSRDKVIIRMPHFSSPLAYCNLEHHTPVSSSSFNKTGWSDLNYKVVSSSLHFTQRHIPPWNTKRFHTVVLSRFFDYLAKIIPHKYLERFCSVWGYDEVEFILQKGD